MTDRYKVYTKVLKIIKQMVKLPHPGHVVTLAMMITGIVMSKKAQLSEMSSEIPGKAKDKSLEIRLRRWVKHAGIDAELIYLPFAQQVLRALSGTELVLVMDGSQAGRGCMVLMVGVLYKKRALPIAWLVYKGEKGHTTAKRHIEVLEKVLPMVPEGAQVVLLGDAEYDTTEMQVWLTENTDWGYVLRTSPQIYVTTEQGEHAIRDIMLVHKQVRYFANVNFTQSEGVYVNLVGWWGQRYEKPIYLISNLVGKFTICLYYRKRYRIETFFSDQKSRGFHIHKSHLSDPERLGRLLVAACLAYLWMIIQGLQVMAERKAALIDRTDRTDKSIFRLGLDWLRYCLKKGLDFEPQFWFQPAPSLSNVR
jgi:hypothetical protein